MRMECCSILILRCYKYSGSYTVDHAVEETFAGIFTVIAADGNTGAILQDKFHMIQFLNGMETYPVSLMTMYEILFQF